MQIKRQIRTGIQLLAGTAMWLCAGSVLAQGTIQNSSAKPLQFPKKNLLLLQPPDDTTASLPPQQDIQIFFTYFNLAWPWLLGIAAGIAVLQALVGGVQIMLSGGDSGKRESGKGRMMWALAGLLMIGLAGLILETLNPLFFRQV